MLIPVSHLPLAVTAAIKAGHKILEIYNQEFDVEFKSDNSPLTIADKNAHDHIIKQLAETGLPMLSEEGASIPFEVRKLWNSYWLIDPLDGTKEFIKHNGEFTVNIALIHLNKPVLGVIYIPVNDVLYFGSSETGSYMLENASVKTENFQFNNFTDQLTSISIRLPLYENSRIFTVVASKSHLSVETENFINQLKIKHDELAIISRGSSLKICLVAEGSADIYPRLAPTMEWDVAAGHAIASFAGCSIKNYNTNEELLYNKEVLLNPHFVVARNGI